MQFRKRRLTQDKLSSLDLQKLYKKLIAANPTDGCALPKLEHREMKTLPMANILSDAI